jgi:hypothetical protein
MSWFHRFDAVWKPTVLLLDAAGKERVRLEGICLTTIHHCSNERSRSYRLCA